MRMMSAIFAAMALSISSGCRNVTIQTVEPWEGRYPTVDDFKAGTQDIQLKDGQCIWVLSNGTMYRLLKKTEK